MALCSSCRNIVPGAVSRCPVCGASPSAPVPAMPEPTGPGWSTPGSAVATDLSWSDTGLHPDDFLAEFFGPEGSAPPVEPHAPTSFDAPPPSSFDAPPPSSFDSFYVDVPAAPAPPSSNGASWLPPPPASPPPPPPVGPMAGGRSALPAPPAPSDFSAFDPPGSTLASFDSPSDDELLPVEPSRLDPDRQDQLIRAVRAASNRIDADITIGPSPHHHLVSIGLPFAAAFVFAASTLALLLFGDVRGSFTEAADVPGSATLAFTDDPRVAAGIAQSASLDVVALDVAACGLPGRQVGTLIAPNRIVTSNAILAYDHAPLVTLPDGTVVTGTVAGFDPDLGLAVVEISPGAATTGLAWGSVDQLYTDPTIVVVERTATGLVGSPVLLDPEADIDGIIGLVESFRLGEGVYAPGAPVVSSDGYLVGMVDATGTRATAGGPLQAAASQIAIGARPAPVPCPVPEPAIDPATGEPATTTTAGG